MNDTPADTPTPMTPRGELEAVRACIVKGWTQNTFARDWNENECDVQDQDAHSFCLAGAILRVTKLTPPNIDESYAFVALSVKALPSSLSNFNDYSTKAEVIAAVDAVLAECPA